MTNSAPHPTHRRRFLAGSLAAGGGVLASSTLGLASPATATPASPQRPETASRGRQVLRTPNERFDNLPDYPFAPHYVNVGAGRGPGLRLRMHYIDEGPSEPSAASGETVVLLHGNPSWSYVWRNIIPPLTAAGHRCIAPDLIGFGRSDKVVDRFSLTYGAQYQWLQEALFERLDLQEVTLVCHDWGGLFGLRLLAEHPDRFLRVVASNTGFDVGEAIRGEGWEYLAMWLKLSQDDGFDPGQVVQGFTLTELAPAVAAAYMAPYPDNAHLEAPRRLALQFPTTGEEEAADASRTAWPVLETLQTPFLCVFSVEDHVSHGEHGELSDRIPGAQGQPHLSIPGAAHFLQEDQPQQLADAINDFIQLTTP